MVLFSTSAWLLHWGWYGVVFKCVVPIRLMTSSETLAQNYFPSSVIISIGMPYLQNHFSKIASATVLASLLLMATSSTYFVNASIIHKMCFFPLPDTTKNPNRSARILWLGWAHWGNGDRSAGLVWSLVLRNWHFWQVFKWVWMSWSIPGRSSSEGFGPWSSVFLQVRIVLLHVLLAIWHPSWSEVQIRPLDLVLRFSEVVCTRFSCV